MGRYKILVQVLMVAYAVSSLLALQAVGCRAVNLIGKDLKLTDDNILPEANNIGRILMDKPEMEGICLEAIRKALA